MSDMISARTAAGILGCTPQWITTLCRNGRLRDATRGHGRGRPWCMPRDSVEQLIESANEEDADPDTFVNQNPILYQKSELKNVPRPNQNWKMYHPMA